MDCCYSSVCSSDLPRKSLSNSKSTAIFLISDELVSFGVIDFISQRWRIRNQIKESQDSHSDALADSEHSNSETSKKVEIWLGGASKIHCPRGCLVFGPSSSSRKNVGLE